MYSCSKLKMTVLDEGIVSFTREIVRFRILSIDFHNKLYETLMSIFTMTSIDKCIIHSRYECLGHILQSIIHNHTIFILSASIITQLDIRLDTYHR